MKIKILLSYVKSTTRLILATWYKKKIKDSILAQVYADKNKVAGVNIDDPQEKEKIYQQYLKAFKKGVYNYIKEDIDPVTQETIPRKYFSGGLNMDLATKVSIEEVPIEQLGDVIKDNKKNLVDETVNVAMAVDNAMLSPGSRIFLDPKETEKLEKMLQAEAMSIMRSTGLKFSTERVNKFVSRAVRETVLRDGLPFRKVQGMIRGILMNQLQYNTFRNTDELWQRAIAKRRHESTVVPSSREAFVGQVIQWVRERYGENIDETQIKLNADRTATTHMATVFGTVIFQLHNGISYLDLYHEMMHLIGDGFVTQWLDEVMTEKLTKDLFDELGEKGVGEKMVYHYYYAQKRLNKVANVVGWQPFIISYLTGDENFVIESLGENGREAFSLLESITMFHGWEDKLVDSILNNLDSKEKLLALGEYLTEQKNLKDQRQISSSEFNERLHHKLLEFAGVANERERYKLSKETYDKLVALSQDVKNPTLYKAAQEMLAKSNRAMQTIDRREFISKSLRLVVGALVAQAVGNMSAETAKPRADDLRRIMVREQKGRIIVLTSNPEKPSLLIVTGARENDPVGSVEYITTEYGKDFNILLYVYNETNPIENLARDLVEGVKPFKGHFDFTVITNSYGAVIFRKAVISPGGDIFSGASLMQQVPTAGGSALAEIVEYPLIGWPVFLTKYGRISSAQNPYGNIEKALYGPEGEKAFNERIPPENVFTIRIGGKGDRHSLEYNRNKGIHERYTNGIGVNVYTIPETPGVNHGNLPQQPGAMKIVRGFLNDAKERFAGNSQQLAEGKNQAMSVSIDLKNVNLRAANVNLTNQQMQEIVHAYLLSKGENPLPAEQLDVQYLGQGAYNIIIGYGNSALRINKDIGGDSYRDGAYFALLAALEIGPKILDRRPITLIINGNPHNILEVERFLDGSREKRHEVLSEQEIIQIQDLLDTLIKNRIFIEDFKLDNIAFKNGKAYILDVDTAKQFDRPFEPKGKELAEMYIQIIESARNRNWVQWTSYDPQGQIIKYLHNQAMNTLAIALRATTAYKLSTPESDEKFNSELDTIAKENQGIHMKAYSDLVTWHENGIILFGYNGVGKSRLAYSLYKKGLAYGGSDTVHLLKFNSHLIAGPSPFALNKNLNLIFRTDDSIKLGNVRKENILPVMKFVSVKTLISIVVDQTLQTPQISILDSPVEMEKSENHEFFGKYFYGLEPMPIPEIRMPRLSDEQFKKVADDIFDLLREKGILHDGGINLKTNGNSAQLSPTRRGFLLKFLPTVIGAAIFAGIDPKLLLAQGDQFGKIKESMDLIDRNNFLESIGDEYDRKEIRSILVSLFAANDVDIRNNALNGLKNVSSKY